MSGNNVIFYIYIIALGLVTLIIVKAHENFAVFRDLKSATWERPCYLYGQWIDCSVLFKSYVMAYPNPRLVAGFITPRNSINLGFNILKNPQTEPFQRSYQPQQLISEKSPHKADYKSSPPSSLTAISSLVYNLPKIEKSTTSTSFQKTTNSVNFIVTEPVRGYSIKATASNTVNIIREDNAVAKTEPDSTSKRHDLLYVQYTSTTSENISYTSEIPILKEVLLPQPKTRLLDRNETFFQSFKETLDRLERKFFLSAFTKLTAISPEDRRENGISFLQSGLFLHLLLVSLTTEMDKNVTQEIEDSLGLNMSEEDKIQMIKLIVSSLPDSSDVLKFRWSSRLVLGPAAPATRGFQAGAAAALALRLSWLNGTETPAEITKFLNEVVEADSGGAMHDTFEEDELSSGVCGVALSTLYVRGRWRAAPTLLNDSRLFRDAAGAPPRYTRLFRVNDLVGYAYLHEWDAEAIEISYATPGLSLLVLVPKEPSLRRLVGQVASAGLARLLAVMHPVRVAVTLPLYTLRMTLLLPNKLQDMGMPSLLSTNGTDCHSLKFSHAVQRLMFWAEAGRNAYKDDGIEWDPRPEMEIVVDRPYLFFVRWLNITLMNGNFVL